MSKILHITLLLVFASLNSWTQEIKEFEFSEEKSVKFITIENNQETVLENIEIIDAKVFPPDSITYPEILSNKIHAAIINRRLTDFNRVNDTLKISFIEYFKPCNNFYISCGYQNKTIDFKINVYPSENFCMSVAHYFEFVILDKERKVEKVSVNERTLENSDQRFLKETITVEKNFFSGKKTIKTYYENVSESNLLLIETFNRKGNLIKRIPYYFGHEIIE